MQDHVKAKSSNCFFSYELLLLFIFVDQNYCHWRSPVYSFEYDNIVWWHQNEPTEILYSLNVPLRPDYSTTSRPRSDYCFSIGYFLVIPRPLFARHTEVCWDLNVTNYINFQSLEDTTSSDWNFIIFQLITLKWNESGSRKPLCTYRLNWARRTFWEWWDDWDDTVLQTQDSKFEPWRSEGEHATFRSRRLPTILTFTRGWGRNIFVSFKPPRPWTEPRTLAWKAAVLATTLGPPPPIKLKIEQSAIWV